MSLVYILLEDGQHATYEESEVEDLLARQILSPETYFWKEGMTDWLPLSELLPQASPSFVPARRNANQGFGPVSPVRTFQPAVTRTQPVSAEHATAPKGPVRASDPSSTPRRKSGRYRLRYNLMPLTICMQILYVGSMGAMAFLIYRCLAKIYGWSKGATPDPMAVLSGTADASGSGSAGVPAVELTSILSFFLGLVFIHMVSEILFYFWIFYANKNCRGMASNMIYTPGWSVACFFIPVLNLFRPYSVIQELWKVSQNPKGWMGRRDSFFVGLWFFVRLSTPIILFTVIIPRGPFHTNYSDSDDPAIRAIGTLIYLVTVEGVFLLTELTTLILVSLITWRQIKWAKQAAG